ncbi:MAG: tetratricopeptide repeat protein, partial [Saprospiraceae bacterium]
PCSLLKGQALYKLGKHEEAIKVFDTVLVEEKKLGFNTDHNFLVHFYKGRCFHSLNDFSNALKSYELVLQLDPNYTEALYQVGLIYKSKGNNILALQYLTKAKDWLKKGKKMGEPYFERFDEVFEYQIDEAIVGLN